MTLDPLVVAALVAGAVALVLGWWWRDVQHMWGGLDAERIRRGTGGGGRADCVSGTPGPDGEGVYYDDDDDDAGRLGF